MPEKMAAYSRTLAFLSARVAAALQLAVCTSRATSLHVDSVKEGGIGCEYMLSICE
jgi:hypothetical protein